MGGVEDFSATLAPFRIEVSFEVNICVRLDCTFKRHFACPVMLSKSCDAGANPSFIAPSNLQVRIASAFITLLRVST
jgi:hypothetical protein